MQPWTSPQWTAGSNLGQAVCFKRGEEFAFATRQLTRVNISLGQIIDNIYGVYNIIYGQIDFTSVMILACDNFTWVVSFAHDNFLRAIMLANA